VLILRGSIESLVKRKIII